MSSAIYYDLELAFDIGYSSIGWSVFKKDVNVIFPDIIGSGVFIFDDEDCQAKARGAFRRIRRNVAARRERIARLRKVLLDMNVMSEEELDNSKTNYPWLLAAQTLVYSKKLSWVELWAVIRFYAHNRGYDGNCLWSKNLDENFDENKKTESTIQDSDDDAKKEKNAKELMKKFGTTTQAETICTFLGVDISSDKKPTLRKYFKGENVAFPRKVVESEVEKIIDAHIGVLPKCDEKFKQLLLGKWREVSSNIILPKTFSSNNGLLFGQKIPRFDNRIISKCPISRKKVPSKHSFDYLEFRWKTLLSNMLLPAENLVKIRKQLDEQMRAYGRLTKTVLKKIFEEILGGLPPNYEAMFLTSDMEEALLFNPVRAEILKILYPNISYSLPPIELVDKLWNAIPKFVFTKMFRFKAYSISDVCELLNETDAKILRDTAEAIFNFSSNPKKSKQNPTPSDFNRLFKKKIKIEKIFGRAPYSRQIMKKACDEIMQGKDPRAIGGVLYRSAEISKEELRTNIDTWTNNHLVRHRLKMFKRLYLDIVKRYAGGDILNVKSVTIEVVKDLTSFSGLNQKEKASKLNAMIVHHKSVYEYIEKEFPELDVNGSILRKARIADDLNWTCPYTEKQFSPRELFADGNMELEHIIPYSFRPSNSLESLVITWKEVNDMKGQRTAMEFIEECQAMQVPGRPNLTITTPARFEKFVNALKRPQHRYAALDIERIKRRKTLLLTEHYNRREGSFLPSDLTQTSHLNKLAFKVVKSIYVDAEKTPELVHLPGSVTSVVRKNWELLPCAGKTCPEIFEISENGDSLLKTKDDIRSITHLHHAVDAIAMGLTASLFPHDKRFYELISKRRLSESEREELKKTGLFNFVEKDWRLVELTPDYLESFANSLAENRVVKHLPKKMSGLKVEQTLWGVVKENDDGKIEIRQYAPATDKKSRRRKKTEKINKSKLLGFSPKNPLTSKLSRKKSVIIINRNYGIALANPPVVIPFHNVWQRMQELAKSNGGKFPNVLRRNQLVEVQTGRYKGIWRISIIADKAKFISVNLLPPIYGNNSKKEKDSVRLSTLIKDGIKILKERPTGI